MVRRRGPWHGWSVHFRGALTPPGGTDNATETALADCPSAQPGGFPRGDRSTSWRRSSERQARRNGCPRSVRRHHGASRGSCGRDLRSRYRRRRSEEHTSELQSRPHLVCRLLLEKKKKAKSKDET